MSCVQSDASVRGQKPPAASHLEWGRRLFQVVHFLPHSEKKDETKPPFFNVSSVSCTSEVNGQGLQKFKH